MMSQVVSADALSGALALVQMALDPKAVKAELDKIAKAKAELDAQRADLAERQEKFNQGKVELREEREAHAASVRRYTKDFEELAAAKSAHENAVKAFAQAEARHAEGVRATEAKHKEREASLAQRERVAVEQIKRAEALVAATNERERKLDEREAAIATAEQDMQTRRAKLAEVLGVGGGA